MKKILFTLLLLLVCSFTFSTSLSRSMSTQANINTNITITLTLTRTDDDNIVAIDETIPAGFTIVSNGGGDNSQTNHLKWIETDLSGNKTYTYTLKSPSTIGSYTFSGIYMSESHETEQVTSGNTSISIVQICTIDDWTSSDGLCQSNDKLIRTWTQVNTACIDGVQKPETQEVDCDYEAPTCESFEYSDWSDCSQTGTKTKTIISSTPSGCQGGTPDDLSTDCIYTPVCREEDWIPTEQSCQPDNTKIITYSKSINCEGGYEPTNPETVDCVYDAPECTINDWTCQDYGVCQSTNQKTRTCTKNNLNCEGGYSPSLTQGCTFIPTCNDSHWDFNLNPEICPSTEIQTKEYFKLINCEGGVTKTDQEITCEYDAPICEYEYSDYGDCINGIKIREVLNNPTNCQGFPELKKTCEIIPNCNESDWSFSLGTCTNGKQTKTWTKINNCNNGIQHTNQTINCNNNQNEIPYCTNEDWNYRIEPTDCPNTGKQTKYWTRTNTNCQGGVINKSQEIINCATNNNNTDFSCVDNDDCAYNENCDNEKCIKLNCTADQIIENHSCENKIQDKKIEDVTSQEILDKINNSNDDEAIDLLDDAQQSLEDGEEKKAIAQINIALLKTKLEDEPNLITQYDQALLALEEGDYDKANELATSTIDKPKENDISSFYPIIIIVIVIILIFLLVFGRQKPELPKPKKAPTKKKKLSETQQLLKNLKDEFK
jgi:hypothetical protein